MLARALAVIGMLLLMASAVHSQLATTGAGGRGGGGGPPPVDCVADGLDFQDGCGTTQFMVIL